MATAPMLEEPQLATAVYIPVEEYLNTPYRPDCDYVDGQLKERNLGEKPHGRLQYFFGRYFWNNRSEWRVEAIPEQRLQVTATRYRIPDVCVVSKDAPDENIIRTPPVLCIEILSQEDRMSEILDRVEDYLKMGVPTVWILDPWKLRAHSVATNRNLQLQTEKMTVPGTKINIPVDEIFAALDSNNA